MVEEWKKVQEKNTEFGEKQKAPIYSYIRGEMTKIFIIFICNSKPVKKGTS